MKDDDDMEIRVHPSHHKPFMRTLFVIQVCSILTITVAAWMWGLTGATVAAVGSLLIILPLSFLKGRPMLDTCVCAQCGKSLNVKGQDEDGYLLYPCRKCGIVWRSWLKMNANDN